VQLVKTRIRVWHVNCLEKSNIQQLQLQRSLINEKNIGEINPLFAFVQEPEAQHKSAQCCCLPNNKTKHSFNTFFLDSRYVL